MSQLFILPTIAFDWPLDWILLESLLMLMQILCADPTSWPVSSTLRISSTLSQSHTVYPVLGLTCCLLVVWTIIVTAVDPPKVADKVNRKTHWSNTMSPVCQLSSAIPLDQVSLLLKDHPAIKAKTKQVNIGSTGNHCKCLCKIETKEDELMETLEVAMEKNWKRKMLLWSKAFDYQFENKQLNILDCF